MTKDIHDNLRKVRKSFDLNQDELAARVHMSKSNYSNYERGEYAITEDKLQLFADALGCTPDYIRNFEEDRAQHIHIANCQTGVGIGIQNQYAGNEDTKTLLAAVIKNLEQNNKNIEQNSKLIELVLQRLTPLHQEPTEGAL